MDQVIGNPGLDDNGLATARVASPHNRYRRYLWSWIHGSIIYAQSVNPVGEAAFAGNALFGPIRKLFTFAVS